MVTKDILLGRECPVYRQISSLKTIAAIINIFDGFLKVESTAVLQDPFTASVNEIIRLCTYFETKYAIAFERALAECFHPNKNMPDYERSYINMCCFGCDLHAKRAILYKVHISEDHRLYGSDDGTPTVTNVQLRLQALTEMTDLGGNGHLCNCGYNKTTWVVLLGSNLSTQKICDGRTYMT